MYNDAISLNTTNTENTSYSIIFFLSVVTTSALLQCLQETVRKNSLICKRHIIGKNRATAAVSIYDE